MASQQGRRQPFVEFSGIIYNERSEAALLDLKFRQNEQGFRIDDFRLMIDGAKRRSRFIGDDLRMVVIFI